MRKPKRLEKQEFVNLEQLSEKFRGEMLQLYERTKKECDYNAVRFLQMVNERGGVEAARQLVHSQRHSEFMLHGGVIEALLKNPQAQVIAARRPDKTPKWCMGQMVAWFSTGKNALYIEVL